MYDMSRSLKRFLNTNISTFKSCKIVSKENTKCDAFRFYVVKSHNSFSLGVNNYRLFTLKEPFLIFFQSFLSGRKRHIIRVQIYGTLFGKCRILLNAHHIIFSILLKFTIPSCLQLSFLFLVTEDVF